MKAIVIYKSKTGFTKKYAEWIAQALACKAAPLEQTKTLDLSGYDTLVFGGWLFAGKVQGLQEFKEKFLSFKGKKAIFATGATPADTPETAQAMNNCFTQEEREHIGAFYLRGGLSYEQMSLVHKLMMKMMCQMMKKEKGVDSEEYKGISKSFDATDKAAIEPIIHYIAQ